MYQNGSNVYYGTSLHVELRMFFAVLGVAVLGFLQEYLLHYILLFFIRCDNHVMAAGVPVQFDLQKCSQSLGPVCMFN